LTKSASLGIGNPLANISVMDRLTGRAFSEAAKAATVNHVASDASMATCAAALVDYFAMGSRA
jgi:hypothetical protein